MACNYFNPMQGVRINRGGAILLEGVGQPSGSALIANVPAGSMYMDNTNGDIWKRNDTLTNTIADWGRLANEEFVNTALAGLSSGISWREPVEVRSTSTTLPLAATNTVDGVTVFDGMRVLFSDGALGNVYIASGTPGAWVWTEDTNTETTGDTVYVGDGTDASFRYTYGVGGVWARTDATSLDELGFIRAFVGKSAAGAILPTYSSNNIVTTGDSLEVAIGDLDAAVQANSDLIGASVTNTTILTPTDTVNQNLDALADFAEEQGLTTSATGVTTTTVIDTIPNTFHMAKWIVELEAPNFHQVSELIGVGDGVAAQDCSEYGIVQVGSATINDVVVETAISGGSLQLVVTSPTTAVTVKAKRIAVN